MKARRNLSLKSAEELVASLQSSTPATDFAWLAGIIDGEGCIRSWYQMQYRKHRKYPRLMVGLHIVNTDARMISKIYEIFLHQLGYTKMEPAKGRRRTRYSWHVVGRQLWVALSLVLPYLVTKKEQGELAIDLQQRFMSFKRRIPLRDVTNGRILPSGPAYDKEELYERDQLHRRLKSLHLTKTPINEGGE